MSDFVSGTDAWMLPMLACGMIYDRVAEAALRRWLDEPPAPFPEAPEPITFFRPLKGGVPRLREKLDVLAAASLPGDQIILGVDPDSPEETVAGEVQRAFSGRDITVVRCAPGVRMNPKISKLVQMEVEARHAAWLLSDSEVIFDSSFLQGFRAEWQTENAVALTAGYRFVNLMSLAQRCDALAILLGLWPGLALVRRFGAVRFTLGACTLLRRDALAAAGGWSAFGCDLAEDRQIGVALAAAGGKVSLSRCVATLDSDSLSWRDYWRHQRRVAVTYRVANPAGFAGMIFTQGLVWCTFYGLFFDRELAVFFPLALAALFRASRLHSTAQMLDFPIARLWPLWVVASVVEAVCWVLSWLTPAVWWGGRRWRVDSRGKLSAINAGKEGSTVAAGEP